MKLDSGVMRLYLVTDRSWLGEKSLAEVTESVLDAGATFLQLREKTLGHDEMLKEAKQLAKLARERNIPFVINDRVDICLESGADGVHVGQHDATAQEVRLKIGPNRILGVSAQTVQQAVEAEAAGADYLGVGDIFGTTTKSDASRVSIETLRQICDAVSIPVVAIGGIHGQNILQLKGSGADGVAVISAVFAEKDPASAARSLRRLSDRMVDRL